MKFKTFLLFFIIFISFMSCVTSEKGQIRDADQIIMDFANGLEDQDIDLLMSAYHESIKFDGGNPDYIFEGKQAVRDMQEEGFNGPPPMVHVEDWKKESNGTGYMYEVLVQFGNEATFLNTFEVLKIDGSWGIEYQSVRFYR